MKQHGGQSGVSPPQGRHLLDATYDPPHVSLVSGPMKRYGG
jgi:hypothetical protein